MTSIAIETKDQHIITWIREKNPKGFKQVYYSYFEMAKYFICKNTGNEDVAKDIFQDALIVLYEKCIHPDFVLTCNLKTYLYSIIRNLWFQYLKKSKRNPIQVVDFETYINIEDQINENENDEQMYKVNTALSDLGERCKELLQYYYYHKWSMKTIAEKMGYTNEDNAKNQKYKCIQQLKSKVFNNG